MTHNELTILVALLGSGIISAGITSAMTRRTNKEVEQLKSRLDVGQYVTKAHYDLELESYKSIWGALSELRLQTRALVFPDEFEIHAHGQTSDEWKIGAAVRASIDFIAAHNAFVRISDQTVPFYPENIKAATELILSIDRLVIDHLSKAEKILSKPWYAEMRRLAGKIDQEVAGVEDLVRSRLMTLRIRD